VTNVPFAKFFAMIAVALVWTLSLAPAQTAPVPASTPAPSAPASGQAAPVHPNGQIGPGATGTISPSQGVTPATAAKAGQMLKGALTPKTRQTLQDAMNATPPETVKAPANASPPPAPAGH
jgi:hypothetical protein